MRVPVAFFVLLVIVIMRFCVRGRQMVSVMALHGAMLTGNRENIGRASRTKVTRCSEIAPYTSTLIGADQHLHMLAHTASEGTERVTAFERGHNASARVLVGDCNQLLRDPAVIRLHPA